MRQVREKGITSTIQAALKHLSAKVDVIYLTVDMDVLDIFYAPGVPAATPVRMRTDELFEAVYLAGRHPLVKSMDIVCLDPYRDVAQVTVKAGVHVMLTFLTGLVQRKELMKKYTDNCQMDEGDLRNESGIKRK